MPRWPGLEGLWIIGYDVAQTDPNLKKVHER